MNGPFPPDDALFAAIILLASAFLMAFGAYKLWL
jgi:hypothetical protein